MSSGTTGYPLSTVELVHIQPLLSVRACQGQQGNFPIDKIEHVCYNTIMLIPFLPLSFILVPAMLFAGFVWKTNIRFHWFF